MRYTIPKGWHYCTAFLQRIIPLRSTYKRTSVIHKANWYSHNIVTHSGHNKLCGRTYGCLNPHQNSMRITWKPAKRAGWFKLYLYWYDDKKRHSLYIAHTQGNKTINISFTHLKNNIKVTLNQHSKLIKFKKELPKWGFQLFPYFGGKDTAYFKMKFDINKA